MQSLRYYILCFISFFKSIIWDFTQLRWAINYFMTWLSQSLTYLCPAMRFPFSLWRFLFAKANHPVLRGNSVKADVCACVKVARMYFCIYFSTQLCLCETCFLICSSIFSAICIAAITKRKKTSWCYSFLSVSCICVRRFAHLITKKTCRS